MENCYHFPIIRKSSITPGNHNSVLEKPCSRWCVSLNNLNKPPFSIKSRLPPQKCLNKLSPPGGLIEDLQYMIYDIIVFENLRFRTSTRKRKAHVFKNLRSGERFWKDPFSVTASPDTSGRWVKLGGGGGGGISVFKEKRIGVDGA